MSADRTEQMDLEDAEIIISQRLRSMRLSAMADAFEEQAQDPNAGLSTFMERFSALVEREWAVRYDKKFARYLRNAHLRYPGADLDQTLYDPARKLDTVTIERLSGCEWIDEGRHLLVTGPSSSGKTYLCNALCVCALRRFKSVRYIRANQLMLELEQAHVKGKYMEALDEFCKLDLLVIDDFGLMELDMDKCRNLFEVIDSREGRKSMIVISQFPVSKWFDIFKDHTYGDAAMQRLTDKRHSYRLEMNGISMRR